MLEKVSPFFLLATQGLKGNQEEEEELPPSELETMVLWLDLPYDLPLLLKQVCLRLRAAWFWRSIIFCLQVLQVPNQLFWDCLSICSSNIQGSVSAQYPKPPPSSCSNYFSHTALSEGRCVLPVLSMQGGNFGSAVSSQKEMHISNFFFVIHFQWCRMKVQCMLLHAEDLARWQMRWAWPWFVRLRIGDLDGPNVIHDLWDHKCWAQDEKAICQM